MSTPQKERKERGGSPQRSRTSNAATAVPKTGDKPKKQRNSASDDEEQQTPEVKPVVERRSKKEQRPERQPPAQEDDTASTAAQSHKSKRLLIEADQQDGDDVRELFGSARGHNIKHPHVSKLADGLTFSYVGLTNVLSNIRSRKFSKSDAAFLAGVIDVVQAASLALHSVAKGRIPRDTRNSNSDIKDELYRLFSDEVEEPTLDGHELSAEVMSLYVRDLRRSLYGACKSIDSKNVKLPTKDNSYRPVILVEGVTEDDEFFTRRKNFLADLYAGTAEKDSIYKAHWLSKSGKKDGFRAFHKEAQSVQRETLGYIIRELDSNGFSYLTKAVARAIAKYALMFIEGERVDARGGPRTVVKGNGSNIRVLQKVITESKTSNENDGDSLFAVYRTIYQKLFDKDIVEPDENAETDFVAFKLQAILKID